MRGSGRTPVSSRTTRDSIARVLACPLTGPPGPSRVAVPKYSGARDELMLFQVNFATRAGGSAKENMESPKRTLALFAKWSPPAGMEIKSSTPGLMARVAR
jgi:hypothetical protein